MFVVHGPRACVLPGFNARLERLLEDFVLDTLVPLATAGVSAGASQTQCHAPSAAWQTKAFHAHVKAVYGSSVIRSDAYYVEASDWSLRIHGNCRTRSLNNVGVSWSVARQQYILGIKTDDDKPSRDFPSAKAALPPFLGLLHALRVPEVFVCDQASVKCKSCGTTTPYISLVRLLASEGTLYEGFPGRFKNTPAVMALKSTLQDHTPRADQDVCKRFLVAHRTKDYSLPCAHACVNQAVRTALSLLRSTTPLQAGTGVFAYQEYILHTAP
jgi:hypothetical protein